MASDSDFSKRARAMLDAKVASVSDQHGASPPSHANYGTSAAVEVIADLLRQAETAEARADAGPTVPRSYPPPTVLDIVCECLQLIQELPTAADRDAAIDALHSIKISCRPLYARGAR